MNTEGFLRVLKNLVFEKTCCLIEALFPMHRVAKRELVWLLTQQLLDHNHGEAEGEVRASTEDSVVVKDKGLP